jgi:hypothetical protein
MSFMTESSEPQCVVIEMLATMWQETEYHDV